jgi:hypothetical protein
MAQGVLSAVQELFSTLSYDDRPPQLWLGDAPLKNPDGSMVDMPIAQFYHENTAGSTTFEYPSLQLWRLRFEVYSRTLDDCEWQCNGILFNNGPPEDHEGLAYTQTLPVPATYIFNAFNVVSLPKFTRLAIQRTDKAEAAYQGVFMLDLVVQRQG